MPPNYDQKIEYAPQTNRAPLLNKQQMIFIQEVTGTFLYYARAINNMMLTALSAITTELSSPTATTLKNTNQFLDYAATNNKAVLTYKANHKVLALHSDASYLNKPQARSRARGHFFMSSNTTFPFNNGAIHDTAQVIKAVMSSAVEAELGML